MRHEESSCSVGPVFISFLLGGMVGAGLAFLLAPQSGKEIRGKIREFAGDVQEKVSDYVSHAKERAASTAEKGKSTFEDKKSAIAAALEAGKEAYEKEVHK